MLAGLAARRSAVANEARVAGLVVLLVGLALPASAQELFVYPEKGQSAEQQEKDEFECYRWARDRTGFAVSWTP